MTCPLAVFAPLLGGRSETFIRRHMEDLLPGNTAVVASSSDRPYGGYWTVDAPILLLNQLEAVGLRKRIGRAALRRLGFRPPDDFVNRKVKKFLRDHQVRVVMGEFLSWSLQWQDLVQSAGARFFGHAHGCDVSVDLRNPKWQTAYLRYNQADGLITMSEFSKVRLVDLGVDPRKIHVIPYGVDVLPQPLSRSEQETIRCLAVGRMVTKKGPILLLDAFRRAAEAVPNLQLEYVGDGELFPAVQQFVCAFNLEHRVILHKGQPSEVVQEWMRKADIFLQHSVTDSETGDEEGLPVAILEAMAHSLPVVSTRHAGIPEAVLEGKTGFLVDECDSKGMAERLIALALDPKLRRRFGMQGWQRATERYSWHQERSELQRVLSLNSHGPD